MGLLLGKEIGPFVIEAELGSGAMGTVYRAFFRDTGQYVAFKIIGIGQLGNETAVARFEREGKILKQLKHPNIVRLIATGHYKKTPFFAMELVDGESLDRILARRSTFSWEEVVELGKQLCAALQHAHMKGIIHRDLKPSNVMVLPDGTVKLTDFGIAKDMDVTALTGANSTVGTAAYMSPEQCRGEKNLTAKSDLYSMGVMFYELLTGRKPFMADSPVDMFMLHVNGAFERPSRLALAIPVWLDTLVCQLMEKKPEHRPFDAAMVASVLEEVEEKAQALRSAGVDAVTARRIDRPRAVAEDIDREAARALRGAVTRKKIRKKAGPWFQRGWVRASALVLVLVAIMAVIYVLTRPPSAEKLYALAKSAVDANRDDQVIEATQRFLDVYPRLDDERARDVRAWRERFWVAKREQQLFNRFERKMSPDDDGQRLSASAMRYEDDGDIENADRVWHEMEDLFANSSEPEPAVYAWVAKKKRNDLRSIDERTQALSRVLDQQRKGRQLDYKPESEAERQSLEALRYEQFGDIPAALEAWTKLREQNLKPLVVRPWGILAANHAQQLKTRSVTGAEAIHGFRLKLLEARLAALAGVTSKADPKDRLDAMQVCRDMIALYFRDPDPAIAAIAAQAKQKLHDLGG